MKKLLFIPLSLLLVSNICANALCNSNESDPKQVVIIPERNPIIPDIIPRDLNRPIVEALLYCNSGNLLFTFNENIGEVTITVNDANGNVVATSTCDSSVSDSATMVVPTLAGLYTISVVGEQFSGEGSYELL